MAASPSSQILPAVWKLIKLRLRISINGFKRARPGRKVLSILAWIGLAAFAAGLCVGSWLLLDFLRSPELSQYIRVDTATFLPAVPALIFATLFLGVLLTGFGVLLQALYLSGDMDFLLAAPVPIRAVFTAKLLQAVLPNFGLVALFGLPVLYGLGIAEGYHFLYYPLVLLVMAALALAASGLAALAVMLVVRVLPPRRAAEILGFLGATIGLVCGQSGNLMNTLGRDADLSVSQANNLASLLLRANSAWSPLSWAGRGLVALGQSDWAAGLFYLTLTLGLSALAFLFALAIAERWFYTGWAGMQVVTHRKRPARVGRPAGAVRSAPRGGLLRLIPAPVRALVWKDTQVYRRDLRHLSQLISPLILGVMYTLVIFRTGGQVPAGEGDAPAWFMDALRFLMTYSSVGMSLFVGWMTLSRLAGMAFSSEGRNYWILKSAPLRAGYLLTAKFIVAYVPAFALGLFFLSAITIAQKLSAGTFLYSLLAMAGCLAGMTGILLGFGAAGARFDWEDPRKMNAGNMGCLGQLIAALYLPLSFGLFIGPLLLVTAVGLPLWSGYLAGAVLGVAVSLLGMLLPPRMAMKKVAGLGES